MQLRKQVTRQGYVQGRFANRTYNYSGDGNRQWNNMQFDLQGRYRFSKKLTLGAKLNQYQMVRKEDGSKEPRWT